MSNLSRRQIAQRLGMSVRTLARHEARLGLAAIKVRLSRKMIRYPSAQVARVFKSKGLE
jgi:hypothetical protein